LEYLEDLSVAKYTSVYGVQTFNLHPCVLVTEIEGHICTNIDYVDIIKPHTAHKECLLIEINRIIEFTISIRTCS
jgi:hypothetical protein